MRNHRNTIIALAITIGVLGTRGLIVKNVKAMTNNTITKTRKNSMSREHNQQKKEHQGRDGHNMGRNMSKHMREMHKWMEKNGIDSQKSSSYLMSTHMKQGATMMGMMGMMENPDH